MTFQVVRDERPSVGDAASLTQSPPTITSTGNTTATLGTDSYGSFQVLAFLDTNPNNGHWDTGEKGITLPYILVRATPTNWFSGDTSKPATLGLPSFRNNTLAVDNVNPTFLFLSTGDNNLTSPGILFKADVTLVAGGPDGRRGLDRVFFAWSNNITGLTAGANYPANLVNGNARTLTWMFVSNRGTSDPTTPVFFQKGVKNPVPATGLSFPLLDTARFPTLSIPPSRDGAIDIAIYQSLEVGSLTVTPLALGEKREIKDFDSPSIIFPIMPGDPKLPAPLFTDAGAITSFVAIHGGNCAIHLDL